MATDSIYSHTPVLTNVNDGTAIETATTFVVLAGGDGYITKARAFFPDTVSGTWTWALYSYTNESTGTQRATVDMTSVAAPGWQTKDLASPWAVAAGENYKAVLHSSSGRYVATVNFFASHEEDSPGGKLAAWADGDGGHRNGTFDEVGSISYPVTAAGGNGYFVDVVWSDTGAPPAFTGSGNAALGLAAAGSGASARSGSGSAGLSFAAAGHGSAVRTGHGSAGLNLAAASSGAAVRMGHGSAGLGLAAAGSGTALRRGSGAAQMNFRAYVISVARPGRLTATTTGGPALVASSNPSGDLGASTYV